MPLLNAIGLRNLNRFFVQSYQNLSFIYDFAILATIFIYVFGEGAKRAHLMGKENEKGSHKLGVVIAVILAFLLDLYIHQRGFKLSDATPVLIIAILGVFTFFLWRLIDNAVTAMKGGEHNRLISVGIALIIFNYLLSTLIAVRFLSGGAGFWAIIEEILTLTYLAMIFIGLAALIKYLMTRVAEGQGTTSGEHLKTRFAKYIGEPIANGLKKGWEKLTTALEKGKENETMLTSATQSTGKARNAALAAANRYSQHYVWIRGQNGILERLAANQRPTDADLQRAGTILTADADAAAKALRETFGQMRQSCSRTDQNMATLSTDIKTFGEEKFEKEAKAGKALVERLLGKKMEREFKGDPAKLASLRNEMDLRLKKHLDDFETKVTLVRTPFSDIKTQAGNYKPLVPKVDAVMATSKPLDDLPGALPGITQAILNNPASADAWMALARALIDSQNTAQAVGHALEDLAHELDIAKTSNLGIDQDFQKIEADWAELDKLNKSIEEETNALLQQIELHERGEKIGAKWSAAIAVLEKFSGTHMLDKTNAASIYTDYTDKVHMPLERIRTLNLKQLEEAAGVANDIKKRAATLLDAVGKTPADVMNSFVGRLEAEKSPLKLPAQRVAEARERIAGQRKPILDAVSNISTLANKFLAAVVAAQEAEQKTLPKTSAKKSGKAGAATRALEPNGAIVNAFLEAEDIADATQKSDAKERRAAILFQLVTADKDSAIGAYHELLVLREACQAAAEALREYRTLGGK